MTIPPEFTTIDDGDCDATVRTVPFGAASEVTVSLTTYDYGVVVSMNLGSGTPDTDGSCSFSVSLPRVSFAADQIYRVTVESTTHSLQLTWDVPGRVLIEQDTLTLALNDKVLRW